MKLLMVSLGCDKNTVDSEKMLGILSSKGFEITDDELEADAAVINTCCFIEDAKKESIETILDIADLKNTGKLRALIVTGCMAQRYRREITKSIPEVDAIVGPTGIDGIADAVTNALNGQHDEVFSDISIDPVIKERRLLTTGGYYAYLKIAEGCDKYCTYCIIPYIRGHFRSRKIEDLLDEARDLASRGVRELILVAEETTLYGTDLYGKKCLHLLLKELCRLEGIRWIRILYCYPEEIYPELIDTMAGEPKICHYLDLPIQSGSDRILKAMNRKTTRADLMTLIADLREKIPDIVLRTTLIAGFPGETEEDQQSTLEFVNRMQFDRLGVFLYSKEEGTPAAGFRPQIPKALKKKRQRQIMELQQLISLEKGEQRFGQVLDVLIEGKVADEDVYIGRTYGDAPNVDGFIFIDTTRELLSGDFVKARVTGNSEYDLKGELIDEFA